MLFEGLTAIPGVFLQKPEGAFYCMAKLPVENTDDFAVWLLSEFEHEGETVMLAPATGFYASDHLGRSEVRIAYVLKEADLRRSVELLRIALERYTPNNVTILLAPTLALRAAFACQGEHHETPSSRS